MGRNLYVLPGVTLEKRGKPHDVKVLPVSEIALVPDHNAILVPLALWDTVVAWYEQNQHRVLLLNVFVPKGADKKAAVKAFSYGDCDSMINQGDSWEKMLDLLELPDYPESTTA